MPRIPVSQIPQAPGPGQPVLTNSPNWRADFSGAAGNMMQKQAPVEPFLAPGRGMQAIGAAVEGAGRLVADISHQMQEAQDAISLSQADEFMRGKFAEHMNEMQARRPEEWAGEWEKRLPKIAEGLNEYRLSNSGKRDLQMRFDRFSGRSKVDVATQGVKQSLQLGRMSVENNIAAMVADGNYEEAELIGQQSVSSGLFAQEEMDRMMRRKEEEVRQQMVSAWIQNDPMTAMEDLEQAGKTGRSETFPHLRPTEIAQARGAARQQFTIQRRDTIEEISSLLDTGEIVSEEQIDEMGQGRLKDSDIRGLKKALQSRSVDAYEFGTLMNDIHSWSPDRNADIHSITEEWIELNARVNQLPTGTPESAGYRDKARSELTARNRQITNQLFGPPPDDKPIYRDIRSMSSEMWTFMDREMELFGEEPKTTDERQERARLHSEYMDFVDDLRAREPDLSHRDFQERASEWAARHAIEPERGRWQKLKDWLPWNRGKENSTDQEWMNEILGPTSGTGSFSPGMEHLSGETPRQQASTGRQPAAIRHNNPGAMWHVRGSWQERFGAEFGQKLNDGLGQGNQIATFPTPVHGAAALMYQLNRPLYRDETVRGAITKWSGGNNVDSYLSVLGGAGFSADQKISDILDSEQSAMDFAKAMARHEAGREFPLAENQWKQAYRMFREEAGA